MSPCPSVRDFQPADFETLWRMDQECFPPGIAYSRGTEGLHARPRIIHAGSCRRSEEGRESGRSRFGKGLATFSSNRLRQSRAAHLTGFIVAYDGPTGHVITIDVIAAARRSGVGSLLLQAAEDRLRAAGSRAVGLETAVDNLAALSFYKRHGYNVVRTWPRYYSNGVDALVMRKEFT